jgi:hypothetical protein
MGLIWESEETIQLRKVFRIRVKLQKLLLTPDDAVDDNALSKANVLLTELESLNINFSILMESKIGKILSIISRLNIPEYDINKRAEALLTKWKTYIPTPVAVSLYEAAVTASEQGPQNRLNLNFSDINGFDVFDNNEFGTSSNNDSLLPMNGRRRRRRNIYIHDSFTDLARMIYNNNNNNNGASSSNTNLNALFHDEPFDEESVTLLGNGGRRIRRATITNNNNNNNNNNNSNNTLSDVVSVPSINLLPFGSNRPITTSPLPSTVINSFEQESSNDNDSNENNGSNGNSTNLVRRSSIRGRNNNYNIRRSSRHAFFNHDGITYNDAPHISNTFHTNVMQESGTAESGREERTRYYTSFLNASPATTRTTQLIYSSQRQPNSNDNGEGRVSPSIVLNSDDTDSTETRLHPRRRNAVTSFTTATTNNLLTGNIMASPLPDTRITSFDNNNNNSSSNNNNSNNSNNNNINSNNNNNSQNEEGNRITTLLNSTNPVNRSNSGNHLSVGNNISTSTVTSSYTESINRPTYNSLSEVSPYDLGLLIR